MGRGGVVNEFVLSFCSFGALFVSVVADEQGKSRFGKQSDLIIQLRFGTSLV